MAGRSSPAVDCSDLARVRSPWLRYGDDEHTRTHAHVRVICRVCDDACARAENMHGPYRFTQRTRLDRYTNAPLPAGEVISKLHCSLRMLHTNTHTHTHTHTDVHTSCAHVWPQWTSRTSLLLQPGIDNMTAVLCADCAPYAMRA